MNQRCGSKKSRKRMRRRESERERERCRRAKEEKTDFRKSVWCSSAFVRRAALHKNARCGQSTGYMGPLGRSAAILSQPDGVGRPHQDVEVAVDWCIVVITGYHRL